MVLLCECLPHHHHHWHGKNRSTQSSWIRSKHILRLGNVEDKKAIPWNGRFGCKNTNIVILKSNRLMDVNEPNKMFITAYEFTFLCYSNRYVAHTFECFGATFVWPVQCVCLLACLLVYMLCQVNRKYRFDKETAIKFNWLKMLPFYVDLHDKLSMRTDCRTMIMHIYKV